MDPDPFGPAGSTSAGESSTKIKRNRRNDQVFPTDGTGGSGSGSEMRGQRGRRKPNPPIPVEQDGPDTPLSHLLEIAAGADVMEEVAAFAGRQQRSVCVLSGYGYIANPTLRHTEGPPGAVVTLNGPFQILSMSGIFVVPSPCLPGSVELTVYIDGGRGQVVGGSVVGKLVAAGPVMVKTATWSCATNEHLPAAGEEISDAAADVTPAGSDGMQLPFISPLRLQQTGIPGQGQQPGLVVPTQPGQKIPGLGELDHAHGPVLGLSFEPERRVLPDLNISLLKRPFSGPARRLARPELCLGIRKMLGSARALWSFRFAKELRPMGSAR